MVEFREKEKIKKIRVKNCKCVADEVFREKGERKKGKKRKKESWNVLEVGGSGRDKKRK